MPTKGCSSTGAQGVQHLPETSDTSPVTWGVDVVEPL